MNPSSQGQRTYQQGWIFDQAFYPCGIGTNPHCLALKLQQSKSKEKDNGFGAWLEYKRDWADVAVLGFWQFILVLGCYAAQLNV
ncbi:hypothetical protein SLA2020_206290 [Shorea laevis]